MKIGLYVFFYKENGLKLEVKNRLKNIRNLADSLAPIEAASFLCA